MKIENSDAFKKWLVKNLNTIFDGEPEKLALYIIALSKKFENDQASKERCCKDLEVFLESNTTQFVENLFSALVTNSYLNTSNSTTHTNSNNTTTPVTPVTPATTTTSLSSETSGLANQTESASSLIDEGVSRKRDETSTGRSRRPSESRTSYKNRLSIDYQEIDVGTQGRRSDSSGRRKTRRNRYRTHRGLDSPNSSSSSSPSTTGGRRGDSYRRSYSRSRSRSQSGSPSPKNYDLNDQAGQPDLGRSSNTDASGGGGGGGGGGNNESNVSAHSHYLYDQHGKGMSNMYNQSAAGGGGYHHHQSNYMGRGQMMQGRHHPAGNMKQPRRNLPPNQGAGLLPLPMPSQMMSQAPNNRFMNMSQPPPPTGFNQRPMMQPPPQPPPNMGMGLMPNPNQPLAPGNNINNNSNMVDNNNFSNQQQRPLMGMNMNRQRNLVNIVTSMNDQGSGQGDMFAHQQQFQQPPPALPSQFQQPPPQFQQPPPQFQQPPPSFQPQQPPPQFQSNQFGQSQQQQQSGSMMMPPGGPNNNMPPSRGLKRSYNNANTGGQSTFNRNDGLMQTPNLMNPPPFINYNNNGGAPGGTGGQQMPALLPTPNIPQLSHPPPSTPQQLQQPPPSLQAPADSSGQQLNSSQSINPNTTLVVRKVPVELNRVEKMHEHFAQFGPIVDVKCQFDQHSDAALIQFATNAQALAAYKCPQPVFNNRFIRLFWYLNYQKQQSYLPQQQQQQQPMSSQHPGKMQAPTTSSDEPVSKKPVKERLGYVNKPPYGQVGHYSEASESPNETRNKENQRSNKGGKDSESADQIGTETTENADQPKSGDGEEASTSTAGETNKNQQLTSNFNSLSIEKKSTTYTNPALVKAQHDENQKKALMLKLEVQKKARELIEKQIKDQKLLLQKFEQAKTVEEKSQILMLVKKLNESIEKEKEILNKKPPIVGAPGQEGQSLFKTSATQFSFQKHPKTTSLVVPPPPHSLKLNNKRLNNTNFLRNPYAASKVAGDKMMVTSKTLPAPVSVANVAAAAAAASSAGFGATFQNYARVDNRPKSLLITGIENVQEKTSLVNFVRSLGCQIESVIDQNTENPQSSESSGEQLSMQINFMSRKDAEIALAKCSSSLNSKTISITWCKSEPVVAKPAAILPDQDAEPKKTDDESESQKSLQTPDVSVADILPSSSTVHSQDDDTTNSESNDSIANLVRTATNNLKAEEDEEEQEEQEDQENVNVDITATETNIMADLPADNDNANDNSDIFDMLFESKDGDAEGAAGGEQSSN